MSDWQLDFKHMPRPMAAAEARVYTVSEDGKRRAIFVDEQIRHKTLFEHGSD